MTEIKFLQNNVNRKADYMVTCLEIGLDIGSDFILFQEPYIKDLFTISHPAYDAILPENPKFRPRVAIFYKKTSKFQYHQKNTQSSDLLIIDILGSNIQDLQLINIYNEKSLDKDSNEYTIERDLMNINPSKNCILAGDFNAHHSWWNSSIQSALRADSLINWLNKFKFDLISEPDISTLCRKNQSNISVIDLVFFSQRLNNKYFSIWNINHEIASGSDHEILLFSIFDSNNTENLVLNPISEYPFNFEKADWKLFSEKIILLETSPEFEWNQEADSNLNSESITQHLELEAEKLQKIIHLAAEAAIPKRKPFSGSKAWWSTNLKNLRKSFGKARKQWKKYYSDPDYQIYIKARNLYFQEIKNAKNQLWNQFLESAKGKDIFKAYSYTKKRFLGRLPTLYYDNKEAITFSQKTEAFFDVLFKEPPISEPIDWNKVIFQSKYPWPDIKDKEIESAIFQSSPKKAPGPDKLSFLILQKAYLNIPKRFNKLYKTLLGKGIHPKIWKKAKGVILRKEGRDYSIPKSYRVISLLNCLGKISEKILAKRLANLADLPNSDLLYHDQIGGRSKKSAIDAVLSLVHDIQMEKINKRNTSVLLLDIKGAFDHVSKNQFLRICIKIGLPEYLIKWILSFLSDREIQLAFDNEISLFTSVIVGIPQGSPISPILFLIYIRYLFDFTEESNRIKIELVKARYPSYIDDIGISVSSENIEKNCQTLDKIGDWIIRKGESNHIQFDREKMELIHFPLKRNLDLENSNLWVQFNGIEIKPKRSVKWLGIQIDSELKFKEHVDIRTSKATRIFHQIERLSNTERGLSFQAMRQLYIACITSVADYGVPIWWANQAQFINKYQKIQNQALQKILGAFKKSPTRAMEIEASIPPPQVRFNKICRSYILRSLDFNNSHIIKQRLPASFTLNPGESIEPNPRSFYDWNTTQTPKRRRIIRNNNNSDSDSAPNYSPIRRKKRKFPSQIYRLVSLFSPYNWDLFQKSEDIYENRDIQDLLSLNISTLSKDEETKNHKNMISHWIQQGIQDKIILYTDGSRSIKEYNGSGVYLFDPLEYQSFAWNIGAKQEIFDAEYFAIFKALEIAFQKLSRIKEIWIFSDSQSVLKGLQSSLKTRQHFLYEKIYTLAEKIKIWDPNIKIIIQWVPGHMKIFGNEKADEAAKYGAEWTELTPNMGPSKSYISKKLKEKSLQEWENIWENSEKGSHYKQFYMNLKWKANPLRINKVLWSSFQQLKLGHGYFLSYLSKLPDYNTNICNKCDMNQKQTPYHLILQCQDSSQARKNTIGKINPRDRNLYYLFTNKAGQTTLIEFLKESKIASRKWFLETSTD